MRPLEGEGPWHEFLGTTKKNNPFVQSGPFRGLGKYSQYDMPQRASDPRNRNKSEPPPGGYGNRNWFNYKKNEDRSTEETRDVNRGSSGLKRGMDMPKYVRREMPSFGRKEYLSEAIKRRLRTTRNT